jgi:hypothetical protein
VRHFNIELSFLSKHEIGQWQLAVLVLEVTRSQLEQYILFALVQFKSGQWCEMGFLADGQM